jgi:transglutaminase-like putative cysteine protease
MYDIKQFKPTLYTLVLLGLIGFSMAAESMPLLLFSVAAVGLNAWLVMSGRFSPLPRWLANLATIGALLYVAEQIVTAHGPPLMFIGQFLVLLQIIKLFEQRANRDYAQLLVLSLLLMVAACINTASLLFGLLMILYLFVSLYCCLIFHLKVEADRARAAFAIPEEKISPATLRQDQRYLASSMRRLTFMVSTVSVTMAVVVFLFFPRGPGQGVLGQLQFRPASALTGFSDRVSFDQINQIKQNEEVVAHLTVWRNGEAVEGTQTLLLRGYTLDMYGVDANRSSKPQWTRARPRQPLEKEVGDDSPEGRPSFTVPLDPGPVIWRQKILLKPTGSRYLFALGGLLNVKSSRSVTLKYNWTDGSIQTEPVMLPLEYEVLSNNAPTRPDTLKMLSNQVLMYPSESDPTVLEQIRQYTLQPEVTEGLAAQHIFPIDASNEEIARRIEHHLRTNFQYTLDLTDSRKMFAGSDPVVAFLTKVKKGHCEYFASAMALMCQSLNIPARIVVGFKCDEYNTISGQYIIRQSHAHTWVEVLTAKGWMTFDPTSGREANTKRTAGMMGSIKHFVDFLEYKWAEKVVAYENRDRQQLIRELDNAMTNATYDASNWLLKLRRGGDWLAGLTGESSFWNTSFRILVAVIILMMIVIVMLIIVFVIQQRKLRQRAARIGLDGLPVDQQIRLARQLAFYDQLTQALHRQNIFRPVHLTPLEFSESLVFLPSGVFDSIRRLTHLFYRVRYGNATLPLERQRRLENLVERLTREMGGDRAL